MKSEDIIFEGDIAEITACSQKRTSISIMYRIKVVNNMYFFAEEISTGAIFPTYFINGDKSHFNVTTSSYLKNGKYFIFVGVETPKDFIGSSSFSLKCQKENQKTPDIDEINMYLDNADSRFKDKIKKLASENDFICDVDIIKKAINEEKINYSSQYVTKVDMESIKDFGYDLSTSEDLCNVFGRDNELKEVIKKVAIKNNSVILVGEAGNGKTAIVETLALLIKNGTNKWLKDKTIISISTTSLLADTMYRGTFENNIKNLIDFCRKNKRKVILFIDEIHTLKRLGTSRDETLDAMNMLKPYLSNKDVVIIGATTNKEYNILVDDEAFCGRFDKIYVNSLSKEMNIQILKNYIIKLSSIYDVSFPFSEQEVSFILNCLLDVTDKKNQRIIGNSMVTNPRFAKSILEDIFVEAVYNENKEVLISDVYEAIINCEKISPTIRKEVSISLRKKLESLTCLENNCDNNYLVLSPVKKKVVELNFCLK